jgi:tetratricopeptide (TPR) repeat protein
MTANEAELLEAEAQTYLAKQQLEEARRRYLRICELRPGDAESWLMLGVLEGEVGHRDTAFQALGSAVALDDAFAEAHLALAHLHHSNGDRAAARAAVDQAVASDPDYGEAQVFLGALLGESRQFAEAASACRRAVELLPESADALANLGNALNQLGQPAPAETAYRQALVLQPGRAELLSGLGNVLAGLGKTDEAIEVLRQAQGAQPDLPDVHTGLGIARLSRGEFDKALTHFQQRLMLTPGFALGKVHEGLALRGLNRDQEADASFSAALAEGDDATLPLAYNMLGTVRAEDGKPDEALAYYDRALALSPNYLAALDNSGRALEALGRFEEALERYRRAAELAPASADLAGNQASILQRLGDHEQASRLIAPFLDPAKVTPRVAEVFSRLCGKHERCDEAKTLLEGLLEEQSEHRVRRPLSFALGKLLDGMGDYEHAFQAFSQANEAKTSVYDRAGFRRYVDGLVATFSKALVALLPRATTTSDTPIFIVGMPRSGTSLVEQILASHPDVHGGGELRNLFDLVNTLPARLGGLPYPSCVPSLTQAVADGLSREYLGQVSALAPASRFITDKMPHNFLHLGLIHVLFPEARVIHCSRDPLDTCLSIYFQDFTGYHPYAYNLTDLGTHYREYQRLMDHWRSTLGMPLLDIGYEALVADQEAVSRTLVEFCGLEWDERCLRFHDTERTTRTASFDQVRQPIYQASVGRWRHYEVWLDELKKALGESGGS